MTRIFVEKVVDVVAEEKTRVTSDPTVHYSQTL
jgi:hypothetical protein